MPYNSQKIGYAGGSKTSKNAAYNDLNGKITIRQQVFNLFKTHENLTTEEAAELCGKAEISVQPRLSELKNSGLIRNSGKTKQGKWGLQITIWELT